VPLTLVAAGTFGLLFALTLRMANRYEDALPSVAYTSSALKPWRPADGPVGAARRSNSPATSSRQDGAITVGRETVPRPSPASVRLRAARQERHELREADLRRLYFASVGGGPPGDTFEVIPLEPSSAGILHRTGAAQDRPETSVQYHRRLD
jgi:hypothetical protein